MRGLHNGNVYFAGICFIVVYFFRFGANFKSSKHSSYTLMSGANAISGIALVGALMLSSSGQMQDILAFGAILFASINVFGGYLVTNRMLSMFQKK